MGLAGRIVTSVIRSPGQSGLSHRKRSLNGANGLGSVFKLIPGNGSWTFTDLYDITGGNHSCSPYGSVAVDANGNVFGTNVVGGNNNHGVVFEITP